MSGVGPALAGGMRIIVRPDVDELVGDREAGLRIEKITVAGEVGADHRLAEHHRLDHAEPSPSERCSET